MYKRASSLHLLLIFTIATIVFWYTNTSDFLSHMGIGKKSGFFDFFRKKDILEYNLYILAIWVWKIWETEMK